MLSMTEINMMLKDNMQRQLREVKKLPADLAIGYKQWVRGLVKTAAQQIAAEANSAPASQEQANA